MVKLTFDPDSGNAWEATLKEGENTIGRAADNDVRVEEGGVSNHHCRVNVNHGVVTITDLNSTNGVLSNGARVTQSTWAPGQVFHLGPLPVRLDAPLAPVVAITPVPAFAGSAIAASTASPPPPTSSSPVRLRISGSAAAPPPEAASVAAAPAGEADAMPELGHSSPSVSPVFVTIPASTRCRSHNAAPARWSCPKCNKYFCDLCVTTRATGSSSAHLCRACGSQCLPVQFERGVGEGERGFFARIPGAFVYPFRGAGSLVLVIATVIFAAVGVMAGMFSILLKVLITGYLFLFLQNILHSTAAEEDTMPSLPEFDGLFAAFFTLIGTVLISFIVPVGLGIAKLCDVEIPMSAFIASIFVSLLYFPMAFLAVAMIDSVAAANPLVVIPSILRVPGQYLVTVILLCGVYGVRLLGDAMASAAGDVTYTTTDMSVMFATLALQAVWSFIGIYLLVVCMRILGLLYLTQREKLGWI